MSRKKPIEEYVSPNLSAFPIGRASGSPKALETEIGTRGQINQLENTYVWGAADNLPMLILDAICESPTTTSCLGTTEMFVRGAGFDDPGIGKMVIDKEGTTLDEFHAQLVCNLVPLRGFSVNFKFDGQSKITNSYPIGTETMRLVAPPEGSKTVDYVKHNPYWGTLEYNQVNTCKFPLWNPAKLDDDIKEFGIKFPGQVYLFGKPRAPFKHYPIPKYWSAKKWIYSDAKIATYVDELLGNGFFQSVLMTIVGNPNEKSKNPKYQREITGDDGVKRTESTKTIAEEFDIAMSTNFSGVQKAGTAFVKWVANKDQVVDIQEFPTNADFAFVEGVILNTIRAITIGTQVPAILANLPNSISSLAGGDAEKHAIEFMQNNTLGDRVTLENFYNNIMLPNLQKATSARVKIKNYIPITTQVVVDKNIWDFLNEAEKADFVTNNVPNVKIIRVIAPPAPVVPAPVPDPNLPTPTQVDENLKNLKVSEINRVSSIVSKFTKGQLTLEQASQLMASYGFSTEQIAAWLPISNGVMV